MLFALSREELVASLGEEAVFVAPSGSLEPAAENSPAGRLLTSVGIPTGVFQPQKRMESGRFPLVDERIELTGYEAPPGCGAWVVFGWIPQTHLALDPGTGKVHGFSENGGPVQEVHADMSSLSYLAFALHRLLKEFTWSDDEEDEEDDFERLAHSLEQIRATVSARDPLPFTGGSVWPAVLDDMEAGMWS
ncbi:SUKH-4 family immunity protein [Streptomyces sp. NBC_01218]|uniref:SUKH-4 family immunity protein n=1 Tax=unclassified Streptomyces TaxID=2593676 RepID=UPI0023B88685|nr:MULTISPECIES: SUKH-4 family immunity protein [unclassified Streptomyces]WEH38844.1 SUKH-4 family immunity protein [Streptomyces sp. AM 2-1-1]WSQ50507.1 SUKH-4 family immunity protein [Streptomyces sp. NBC_01218]